MAVVVDVLLLLLLATVRRAKSSQSRDEGVLKVKGAGEGDVPKTKRPEALFDEEAATTKGDGGTTGKREAGSLMVKD